MITGTRLFRFFDRVVQGWDQRAQFLSVVQDQACDVDAFVFCLLLLPSGVTVKHWCGLIRVSGWKQQALCMHAVILVG
jgi:hypothetical protein